MILKSDSHEYEIFHDEEGWYYVIYDPKYNESKKIVLIESDIFYETAKKASFSAIKRIDSLKNGG